MENLQENVVNQYQTMMVKFAACYIATNPMV